MVDVTKTFHNDIREATILLSVLSSVIHGISAEEFDSYTICQGRANRSGSSEVDDLLIILELFDLSLSISHQEPN